MLRRRLDGSSDEVMMIAYEKSVAYSGDERPCFALPCANLLTEPL